MAELLGGHALLDVRLETGRTHQIRVHLAAIDLPVMGDPVYGVPDQALGRQFLHASRLAFDHPFTGERVDVESPLPPELDAYLGRLRGQRLESSDLVTVPAGRRVAVPLGERFHPHAAG